MKRTITLMCATALSASLPLWAQQTGTVDIDVETTYQQIDGFGGCGMNGQWADVYTQEKVDLLWGKDGMGYNIMRIRISPNESDWNSYVNPVKWAKAHGAIVFATPWTPPHRFKVNAEQTWGESSNYGSLNMDSVEVYAQWLERYRQHMEEQDAAIDILSVQNECDYEPDGYESCLYSVAEMAEMVQAAKKYINCQIMAPECFGWGSHTYNRELANTSAAVRNSIDIWGNHLYGTNDLTYVNYITSLTKRPMWMTEFIQQDETKLGKWEDACEFVDQVDTCMKVGFSAYVYYNMLDHFFGDGTGGGDTSLPGKAAHLLSHYAKYATGMTRVEATFANTPALGTAYVSAGGDTVSLFVRNWGADDATLTVNLPFESRQVYSILTNESRNSYRRDVSEQYAGTSTPEISLLGGTFHTFLFIRTEADTSQQPDDEPTLLSACKEATQINPICPYLFCADPTAIEHDGRLYVYGTNDQQQFNATEGLAANSYGYIKSLVVMSTEDLVNWTFHGTIDMEAVCGSWMAASWAPSVVSRVEDDGLTHFYLYFSNSGGGVGVITSTSPTGPWTDPLGQSLISADTPGLGLCSNPFDPGVVIDDDGTAWLAFGGGDPNAEGTELLPGNARIVRLGADMISLDSEIASIPAPYHFEANELNVMGGRLVYSYCTSWRERTDWSSYGSSKTAPSSCSICYMTSNDPLNPDSWSYEGEYFANPGAAGFPYGNNHTRLQKFGSSYLLLYHTQWLEEQMGITGGYRSIGMNRATVLESRRSISAVTPSNTGTLQLTAQRPDAFVRQNAETLCTAIGVLPESDTEQDGFCLARIQSGGWSMVKGVSFGNDGIAKFTARLQGEGTLEVRMGQLEADPLVTLDFSSADWADFSVECDSQLVGTYDVYFVFTQAGDGTKFDSWQFESMAGSSIASAGSAAKTPVREEYYTVSGMRLAEKPASGIVIRRTVYSDGSVDTNKESIMRK